VCSRSDKGEKVGINWGATLSILGGPAEGNSHRKALAVFSGFSCQKKCSQV
jgi:hypothetical protein